MNTALNRFYAASSWPPAADVRNDLPRSLGGWSRQSFPDWPSVWGACKRRIYKWRVPPRWSLRDWREELDAECIASACRAIRIFDPDRGPTLASFVYHTVFADALARCRREWSYSLRCGYPSSSRDHPDSTDAVEERFIAAQETQAMMRLVKDLPEPDRLLVERLFWGGLTENEVAGGLGITQQAVSKRKHRILTGLRNTLVQTGQA